jgi:type IV pilus assembly protein PilX
MINKPLLIKRQSGVVLVISLILLLALTMIGVTSTSVTGQQEKMSGNNKDKNLAFQAAEAALRAAEITLSPAPPKFNRTASTVAVTTDQGTNGLYSLLNNDESATTPATIKASPRTPFYNSVDWLATNPKYCVFGAHTTCSDPVNKLVGLYRPPEYIIEEINSIGATSSTTEVHEGGAFIPPSQGRVITYRLTAHGWGSNANSVATLQSIIKVTVTQ